VTTDEDAARLADLLRRLDEGRGEALRTGDVGFLLGGSRQAVDRWLRNGVRFGGKRWFIAYEETPGGHRLCDPADVWRLYLARHTKRSAETADPPPPTTT
jgi:hypothetical protein